jgi:hypothetical protein
MKNALAVVVSWLFTLQTSVLAATPPIQLTNPTGVNTFKQLANEIGGYLWTLSIPVVSIMFIIGGFQMLTAGDNPEKFKTGKHTIQYAAIGMAVILVAQGIIFIIGSLFGISNENLQ